MLKFRSDYKLCTYPLFRNNQNCLDTKVRSYPLHILVFQCSDCHCHSLLRLFCKDWCLNSTSRSFHMLKMNYSVDGQTSYFLVHTSKEPCSVFIVLYIKLAMYAINCENRAWFKGSMHQKQHQWLNNSNYYNVAHGCCDKINITNVTIW